MRDTQLPADFTVTVPPSMQLMDYLRIGKGLGPPQILELLQGQNQVLSAPGETIKAPDQHNIKPSLLGIIHQLIKRRSAVLGAADARHPSCSGALVC